MAWRRPGDKPLSEPMMVSSPTHICVTRPQWVNAYDHNAQHVNDCHSCSWLDWPSSVVRFMAFIGMHDCLFPVTTDAKPLWCESTRVYPIFRGFICPKVLLSEALWGGYAPKNLWSEGPLFRSSSTPKVVMFRRFHIPKGPPLYGFYVTKVL